MSAVNYMLGSSGVENGSGDSKLISGSNGNHVHVGSVNNPHGIVHRPSDLGLHGDIDDDSPENSPGCSSIPYDHQDVPPPKKQKKTKGRVKIKMEFIDNKLRRYTTFSKRKTGIMKKAYELSTLTGTQVMLLVASETGHVYTFATRKLQPMITSESGKALIQTCLNSPDLPGENVGRSPDQRMCATGFEETELTYSISEEDEKDLPRTPMFTVTNVPGAGADVGGIGGATSSGMSLAGTGHTYPMTTYLPTTASSIQAKHNSVVVSGHNGTVSHATGYTALLSQGASLASSGPIPGITAAPISSGLVQVSQGQTHPVHLQTLSSSQATTPTLVRLPHTATNPPLTSAQVQSSIRQPVLTTLLPSALSTSQHEAFVSQANAVAMFTNSQSQLTSSSANTITTPIMYQTPQGVVYAAAAPATPGSITGLAEGVVFNYQSHPSNAQTSGNNRAHTQSFPIALSMPFPGLHLSQAQLPNGTLLGQEHVKKTASTSQSP